MNTNCFIRPNKPLRCETPDFDITVPIINFDSMPKRLAVDKSTECHVTPKDIADRMAEYLDYKFATTETEGNSVLEPHGGTGQLVQAVLDLGVLGGNILVNEKHYSLVSHMEERFSDALVKINQGDFLEKEGVDYLLEGFDRIICNPPFKKIISHIDQVFECLNQGGIAICLVPITYKAIEHQVLEELSNDTFGTCKVNTKIIRITR